MSNHQKRLSAPDSWPVERKTEKFTVKADAGPHGEAGVPLLIILRDVLGYVDSRKEARYALDQDSVLINGKAVSDEERPVGMFDILAFAERAEYYRVFPGEGGRLSLTAIDEESAGSKLGKVVGKRHVPGGDLQLTLHDGQTLVVEEDAPYEGGDSLVVSNEDSEASTEASDASGDEPQAGDVVAHFEYEVGALVTAVDGAHAGEVGTVEEIQVTPGSSENIVRISQADVTDGGFETTENYVVVIDENFTEDGSEEAAADDDQAEAATDEDVVETEAEEDEEADADAAEEAAADDEETDAAAADEAAADDEEADAPAADEAAEDDEEADAAASEEAAADDEEADAAASEEAAADDEETDADPGDEAAEDDEEADADPGDDDAADDEEADAGDGGEDQ